jgi:predicted metal-binding protein
MPHESGPPVNFSDRGVTILVCETCRDETGIVSEPTPGTLLGDRVRRLVDSRPAGGAPVQMGKVACLGNCKRRLSAALILDGGWSYVFGDLTTDSDSDLLVGAELFLTTTDGILPWRGRPASLKRGLVARLPPLPLPSSPDKDKI